MEVKIQCPCGTRYKFDVEPINGLMPGPVSCPTCGVDGTAAGNVIIQQTLSSLAAPLVAAGGQSPTPDKPRMRLNIPTHSAPSLVAAPSPQSVAVPAAPAPFDAGHTAKPRPYPPSEPSLFLGIVGAVVAGLIGMLAWYFICKSTGLKLRFLAIGVGCLTGYGARLFCRKPSTGLGVSAAIVALLIILIGQLSIASTRLSGAIDKTFGEGFEEHVAYAKKAVVEVPNGSDQEIRVFLAKEAAIGGEKPDSKQITEEEVEDFRKELPELRELANGKMTKDQYVKKLKTLEVSDGNKQDVEDTGIYKIIVVAMSFGIFGIFYLIGGVGGAYKIASGSSD